MRFRKKPVVIEAFELGEDSMPDWFMDAVTRNDVILHSRDGELLGAEIVTLEGVHTARAQTRDGHGDFIIRGIQGELYPCKPDIFKATYERAEADLAEGGGDAESQRDRAVELLRGLELHDLPGGRVLMTTSRSEWESDWIKRRDAFLAALTPKEPNKTEDPS